MHISVRTVFAFLMVFVLVGQAGSVFGQSLPSPVNNDEQARLIQERIQARIQPETLPPPGSEKISSGVFSIIAGTLLSGAGMYAAMKGVDYPADSLLGVGLRIGSVASSLTGIVMVSVGMFSVRDAAALSRDYALDRSLQQ